jgi:hypothetical protein
MEPNKTIEDVILPIKIQQLVDVIMQKRNIDFVSALHYLYTTGFYAQLLSADTKYWYESSLELYELIEKEKQTMRKAGEEDQELLLFLVFCLESYKVHTRKTAIETLALFTENKVFQFLTDNYAVLHTQSIAYVLEDIDEFLKNRKA